jgi:general secretion pathway protein F
MAKNIINTPKLNNTLPIMPVYEYKGFDARGKVATGLIDADTVQIAKGKLRRLEVYPTHLIEAGKGQAQSVKLSADISFKSMVERVSLKDLAHMTRQLSTLINAHVPVVESLTALIEQIDNIKLKRIISKIKDNVNQGSSLGNSLELYPRVFSSLYVNMVKAGEASGALDVVLLNLANYTENQLRLKNKIISTIAYPIVMVIIGIAAMTILFTVVIPKITSIFKSLKMALPLPTRVLIGASEVISNYWYLIFGVFIIFIFLLRRYIRTEKGKLKYHRFILKIPVLGKLIRTIAVSRFAGTLSTLLSSGVPLLTALNIVKNIVGNLVLQNVIEKTHRMIKEGDSIAEPLRASGEFPPLVTHMIAIGEKTGTLEDMLKKIQTSYDNDVETEVTTLTGLLEPIMIAFMGIVVGFIIFSVLMPIFDMANLAR